MSIWKHCKKIKTEKTWIMNQYRLKTVKQWTRQEFYDRMKRRKARALLYILIQMLAHWNIWIKEIGKLHWKSFLDAFVWTRAHISQQKQIRVFILKIDVVNILAKHLASYFKNDRFVWIFSHIFLLFFIHLLKNICCCSVFKIGYLET